MSARVMSWVTAVVMCGCVGIAQADYYDNFDDAAWDGDPNLWDIDNPVWDHHEILGDLHQANASTYALSLYVNTALWPYVFTAVLCDDGDYDPNTSETSWDDSQDHYILTKAWFGDPNTGEAFIMLHTNYLTWETFGLGMQSRRPDNPGAGYWSYITSANGTQFNNGDSERRTDLDIAGGFWMCLQWDMVDPNYPAGDPNGKLVRAALWNGEKFDWDGTWDLTSPAGFDYDERGFYYPAGLCGLSAYSAGDNGFPAWCFFDNVEVRTGEFTNVSRTLLVDISNTEHGTVTIDPDLLDDPNGDPNDTSLLRRYTDGTEVVLVATPVEGKGWKNWRIYDPNYPGDANYASLDTNTVLYLTMNQDLDVDAIFKCGSSLPPFVAASLLALGLAAFLRRIT